MQIARVRIAQFVTAEEGDAMISLKLSLTLSPQPKCFRDHLSFNVRSGLLTQIKNNARRYE